MRQSRGAAGSGLGGGGGGGGGANTAATDFVQDYAAKRQAQLERARQIREERLHQQKAQGGGPETGLGPNSGGRPPSSSVTPAVSHPQSNNTVNIGNNNNNDTSTILQVMEQDFKKATQTGIITPDQARQLWAMLSNQAVRVAASASSGRNHNSNFPTASVNSLLALSTQFSQSGSSDGSNKRSGAGGSRHDVDAGMSVSLESLRQSIAKFKDQQRKLNAGGGGGGSLAPPPARQQQQRRHPERDEEDDYEEARGGGGGGGGDNDEEEEEEVAQRADEAEEDPNAIFYRDYDRSSSGGHKYKGTANRKSGKPDWNFDTDAPDVYDRTPSAAAPRKGKSTATTTKPGVSGGKRAAPPPSTSPSSSQQQQQQQQRGPFRGVYDENHPDEDMHKEVWGERGGGTKTAAVASVPRGGGGASAAAEKSRGPPAVPLSLDDVPVGGGGGNFHVKPYPDDATAAARGGGGGVAGSKLRGPAAAAAGRSSGRGPSSAAAAAAPVDVPMTNEEIEAAAAAAAMEPQRPCAICGRSFRVGVLPRHEATCAKVSRSKRKPFDVQGMRLEGVEGIQEVQSTSGGGHNSKGKQGGNGGKAGGAGGGGNQSKLPKWKIQHEQFQAAMKAMHQMRDYEEAVKENNTNNVAARRLVPPPPPPAPLAAELDDRVPCPHCGRKFAEDVAERHIPKCATTVAKPRGIRPIRR